MNNLNLFLRTFHKHNELLIANVKKNIENMFNDIIKYDSRSTLSKNIFEFYRYFENYLSQKKSLLNKFEKEIIEPVSTFGKHLNGRYQESLSELKNV